LEKLVTWCAQTNRTYPENYIKAFAARRNRFDLIREMLDEHADPITSRQGTLVQESRNQD